MYSIESQIEKAKSYVGKTVLSRQPFKGVKHKINRWQCCLSFEDLVIRTRIGSNHTQESKDEFQSVFGKQGIAIAILGENNYCRVIHPDFGYPEIYVEKIKVNGYEAEDMGDWYKIGRAEITKRQLQIAKEFLSENGGVNDGGNRVIQSVKIGAGEFTLDILNQLNLEPVEMNVMDAPDGVYEVMAFRKIRTKGYDYVGIQIRIKGDEIFPIREGDTMRSCYDKSSWENYTVRAVDGETS